VSIELLTSHLVWPLFGVFHILWIITSLWLCARLSQPSPRLGGDSLIDWLIATDARLIPGHGCGVRWIALMAALPLVQALMGALAAFASVLGLCHVPEPPDRSTVGAGVPLLRVASRAADVRLSVTPTRGPGLATATAAAIA